MKYPLELTFKLFTFAPHISVTDANGDLLFYVKQKRFKLKEEIIVYADVKKLKPLYYIKADRIIDFSAAYKFSNADGTNIGSVKRQGMKSLWRARYDIFDGETTTMNIQEKNPWVKVADAICSQIEIIGIFTGYIFNPKYIVSRAGGNIVMHLEKIPSFWSRKFTIKAADKLNSREEEQVLLSLLMMLLLERHRG